MDVETKLRQVRDTKIVASIRDELAMKLAKVFIVQRTELELSPLQSGYNLEDLDTALATIDQLEEETMMRL